MTMPDLRRHDAATVLSADAIFERDVLPFRDELERTARRYTRNAYDAEDLVQETLVKAWAASASFEPGSNRRAWLHRIMINTWISAHRRSERRPKESLRELFTDAQLAAENGRTDTLPSAEDRALQRWPNDDIRRAIQALPKVMQEVLYYADICQYTYKEIAEVADIPVGTVMSRIHRARNRLRVALIDVARELGYAPDDSQEAAA
jgi:RNA polymerase sigma-70 factor (ECF subfamily)